MASNQLSVICSGYSQNCKSPVIAPPTGKQLNFYSAKVLNQSGGAIDAGICKNFALANWKLYKYTAAGNPTGIDYTAAIQGGGSVNIFDTTVNDGFLVGANVPFNIIGLTLAQAQTGAPVYTYNYFNGTAWTTLTLQATPVYTSTGDILIVLPSPQDWAPGTPSPSTSGVDQSKYYIFVSATTAPSQVVQANAAWVCEFLDFQSQLANNTAFDFRVFDSVLPIVLSGTESILPYFGGTANVKNMMRVVYSVQG
jgi:hypothetical protein